jgi:RND family efflux transporter MFP subunit
MNQRMPMRRTFASRFGLIVYRAAPGVLRLAFLFAAAWSLALLAVQAQRAPAGKPISGQVVLGRIVPLPNTVSEVYSPADGRVIAARETPYSVGDAVKKGDPLAIIEHRYNLHDLSHMGTIRWELLSVMLDARRAAVEARVNREKAERLLRLGSASEQEVQALRATEQVAEAEFQKRRVLLEFQDAQVQGSEITRKGLFAPTDGEVSFASFTQGQLITEGVLLYRIIDRREVGFAARFPESDPRPREGNYPVRIHFDSVPIRVYTGTLETVSPTIDPQSRTREVVFRVSNPGLLLRYGMIGYMELEAR